jgi:hypothetical protein
MCGLTQGCSNVLTSVGQFRVFGLDLDLGS